MSETAWLRVGAEVATLSSEWKRKGARPKFSKVARIGKRDVVLDDEQRFSLARLERKNGGAWDGVTRLLPRDDPIVAEALGGGDRELRRERGGRGMSEIYAEVRAERERAHAKHGDTSMESYPADDPTGKRYRILCEEVGEVAKEFNDADHDGRPVDLGLLRKELIQVAAMATAWADSITAEAVTVAAASEEMA